MRKVRISIADCVLLIIRTLRHKKNIDIMAATLRNASQYAQSFHYAGNPIILEFESTLTAQRYAVPTFTLSFASTFAPQQGEAFVIAFAGKSLQFQFVEDPSNNALDLPTPNAYGTSFASFAAYCAHVAQAITALPTLSAMFRMVQINTTTFQYVPHDHIEAATIGTIAFPLPQNLPLVPDLTLQAANVSPQNVANVALSAQVYLDGRFVIQTSVPYYRRTIATENGTVLTPAFAELPLATFLRHLTVPLPLLTQNIFNVSNHTTVQVRYADTYNPVLDSTLGVLGATVTEKLQFSPDIICIAGQTANQSNAQLNPLSPAQRPIVALHDEAGEATASDNDFNHYVHPSQPHWLYLLCTHDLGANVWFHPENLVIRWRVHYSNGFSIAQTPDFEANFYWTKGTVKAFFTAFTQISGLFAPFTPLGHVPTSYELELVRLASANSNDPNVGVVYRHRFTLEQQQYSDTIHYIAYQNDFGGIDVAYLMGNRKDTDVLGGEIYYQQNTAARTQRIVTDASHRTDVEIGTGWLEPHQFDRYRVLAQRRIVWLVGNVEKALLGATTRIEALTFTPYIVVNDSVEKHIGTNNAAMLQALTLRLQPCEDNNAIAL